MSLRKAVQAPAGDLFRHMKRKGGAFDLVVLGLEDRAVARKKGRSIGFRRPQIAAERFEVVAARRTDIRS